MLCPLNPRPVFLNSRSVLASPLHAWLHALPCSSCHACNHFHHCPPTCLCWCRCQPDHPPQSSARPPGSSPRCAGCCCVFPCLPNCGFAKDTWPPAQHVHGCALCSAQAHIKLRPTLSRAVGSSAELMHDELPCYHLCRVQEVSTGRSVARGSWSWLRGMVLVQLQP